jgi:hypothetical protein
MQAMVNMINPLQILSMVVQSEEDPQVDKVPLMVLQWLIEDYVERHKIACDARNGGSPELAEFMDGMRAQTKEFLVEHGFPITIEQADAYIAEEDRLHEELLRAQLQEMSGELN